MVAGADEVVDIWELSPLQREILSRAVFEGESQACVRQSVWDIAGALRPDVLERSWLWALDRHPALRTTLHWRGLDRPVQVVRGDVAAALRLDDWRGLSPAEQE